MSFFYVRENAAGSGTAGSGDGGRYATKQTGDWDTTFTTTSEYYNSIVDAFTATTPPVAGDIIVCSDIHNEDNGGSLLPYVFPAIGIPILVISVDDAAMEVYKAGAKEEANSDIRLTGKAVFQGITLDTSTLIYPTTNAAWWMWDCTLNLTTSSDSIGGTPMGDSAYMELHDCDIVCSVASNGLSFQGGGQFKMFGGGFSGVGLTDLLNPAGGQGGARYEFHGVDLSNITSGNYLSNHGAVQTFDDRLEMIIDRCKLNASVGFVEETLTNPDVYILVTNSSSVSADAEWQVYYEDMFGSIEANDSSGIVRNSGGTVFDGTENISLKVVTSANCSNFSPFSFDFINRFMVLSVASTDTLEIFFASSTSGLTDLDVYPELIYFDFTDKQTPNYITGRPTDVFTASPTTHSDDSGTSDWENNGVDLTTESEYAMKITTAADRASDQYPYLRLHVAIASVTVHFDVVVDTVAA